MNPLGVHLTLLIGPAVPVPAPISLTQAIQSVEVQHSDDGRSGFQITFRAGRSGMAGLIDDPLLSLPLLRAFNRVILVVTFGVVPRVLMDGIITHQEVTPSEDPGSSTITITGEDVSVMMDMEERSAEYPAQDETVIANQIILRYARYGLIPTVIPPVVIDPPVPIERTPVQQSTDLKYLREMADRHGYVFYVTPGPTPGMNMAYWGPPVRTSLPQRALSINMGPNSNVSDIGFRHDATRPTLVKGSVQDRTTGQKVPVQTFASTRVPLSSQPTWLVHQPDVRTRRYRGSGLNTMQAFARAQGTTDATADSVTAEGELDAGRYGDLLQARGLVGVRGAGYSYDGMYYVKRVNHSLGSGSYRQRFTLSRDGVGSTTPVVRP